MENVISMAEMLVIGFCLGGLVVSDFWKWAVKKYGPSILLDN